MNTSCLHQRHAFYFSYLRSPGSDRNLGGLAQHLVLLWNSHAHHTLVYGGSHLARISIFRKRKGAYELPVTALDAVDLVCFLFMLLLTLARNSENVPIGHLDFDILGSQAWCISLNNMCILKNMSVHMRCRMNFWKIERIYVYL